jgi:hypothetical protein
MAESTGDSTANSQATQQSSAAAGAGNGASSAQQHAQSVFTTQRELLDSLEQMNAHWFARAKSEAEQASMLAGRLASARSMPDVTDVYRDWLSRRMQRYVDDTNHVLLDVQKFIETGTRMMQNGGTGAT